LVSYFDLKHLELVIFFQNEKSSQKIRFGFKTDKEIGNMLETSNVKPLPNLNLHY